MEESPQSSELRAGLCFDNYVVGECIGQGAMGHVYRAHHVGLDKSVALKVMQPSLRDQATGHRRFLREAQTAAKVKHPNVVTITDVGVYRGLSYLVMELLEGQDLQSYIVEHGQLADATLAGLALPIIAGVAAAHDAGVIHRDLKPSNIFLARTADGEVVPKVLDFGISKHLTGERGPDELATGSGQVLGTPAYMSPEALNGISRLTQRSDQYSLGVVLYTCCTGQPPFAGDTLMQLIQAIAAGEYKPIREVRPEVSVVLERAIARAMSLQPDDRYEHVRDLGRALWPLAPPRARVLWAPTFNPAESTRQSTLPLATGLDSDAPTVAEMVRASKDRRRIAPALALGALGLGLWVGWGIAREGSKTGTASSAEPLDVQTATMQARAEREPVAAQGVAHAPSEGPPGTAGGPGDLSLVDPSAAGQVSTKATPESQRTGAPAPRRHTKSANKAARRPSKSKRSEPARGLDELFDTAPGGSQPRTAEPTTQLGANDAPIFD